MNHVWSKKYYSAIYQRLAKAEYTQELAKKDEPTEHNHPEFDDDTKLRYEYAEKLLEQYITKYSNWNKFKHISFWS